MPRPVPAVPSAALGARSWVIIAVIGLTGQLAWTVENMYLNLFVYDTISTDPNVIATLVASSAVVATMATMVIGAASDRARTRRPFIAIGYVLWGITTATFGFVSPSGGAGPMNAVLGAVIAIIVLDCVMSFFGSGANDAAFNAWVTESTVPANRGRVDAVLAIMPLLAMLIVFGALDGLTRSGHWRLFFGIVGAATSLVGIVGWALVRDTTPVRSTSDGYLSSLVYGLRPSTVSRSPRLYVLLAAGAITGISTQVYLPYLIIYIQRYLRIDNYAFVLATVLIVASVFSVLGGRVIDRVGKQRAILPAAAVLVIGLLAIFVARSTPAVIIGGIVMMSGMMLTGAAIGANVRDATPVDRVGMVQGLRMIANVLVPMVVGPFIGARVIIGANQTYVDLGVVKQVPTPWIFPAAAGVAVLVVVPVLLLRRFPAATPEPAPDADVAQEAA